MAINRILVAYDGSELADNALKLALEIARGTDGATVDVTHVVTRSSGDFVTLDAVSVAQTLAKVGDMAVERARAVLDSPAAEGVATTTSLLSGSSAATLLLKHAEQTHADLIVMGSRGKRGFTEQFGSVSHAVLHGAKVPVLVTK